MTMKDFATKAFSSMVGAFLGSLVFVVGLLTIAGVVSLWNVSIPAAMLLTVCLVMGGYYGGKHIDFTD